MRRLPEKLLGPLLLVAFGALLAFLLYFGPIANPTGLVTHASGQSSILAESDTGFNAQTRGENYEHLVGKLFSNSNVVTTINDNLWVPWFGSSTQCAQSDLKSGGSCNSGQTIDFTHNCMVTDEFSQVGLLVAMGKDQNRMDQFYNTLGEIESTNGKIPAWRVYRNGNTIEPCRSGINGNCDTASDATARIISALYAASDNIYFVDANKKLSYKQLANTLAAQMVQYETRYECKPSSLGYGNICYWLAAGSEAKKGGLASTDFGYTGYYADAIIAMLQACGQTGNMTFCQVAGNYTLNYLEAAKYNGATFSAPPGRSFKWVNLDGVPQAQCTNGCSPVKWDDADAPRALGMCQALYYSTLIDYELPLLAQYCDDWGDEHAQSATSIVTQYLPNGDAGTSSQSGFFAQGLQSLFHMGYDQSKFPTALDSALNHYNPSMGTWDYTSCFGVYTTAFAMRALGHGLGRDFASFIPLNQQVQDEEQIPQGPLTNISFASSSPSSPLVKVEPNSQTFTISLNNPDNLPTGITWFVDGVNQTARYNQNSFTFQGSYDAQGSYNISVQVKSTANTLNKLFVLVVLDMPAPENNSSQDDQNNAPSTLTVDLQVAQWFPQGLNVVWECVAQQGSGNYEYDYYFGDNEKQLQYQANDTYHTYVEEGTYTANCTVTDTQTQQTATDSTIITVSYDINNSQNSSQNSAQNSSTNNTTNSTNQSNSTNSTNQSNSTNSANQNQSTQPTSTPPTPTTTTLPSGGGGGGGAALDTSETQTTWPQVEQQEPIQVTQNTLQSQNVDPIMITIAQFFSNDAADPVDLVRELLDYFEEQQ